MNLAALWKVSYGMYVVCARSGDRMNGQIANTVFQITAEPPTVAVSICKQNLTHQIIEEGRVFTVSVLSQSAPMELIGRFGFKSGRDLDKLDGVPQKTGRTGAPIVVDHAVACLEAEVVTSVDAGTHTIFVGRIVDAEILGDEPAMTYDYFHVVKRGAAPKTAPTYQAPQAPAPSASTERHRCTVCGHVYDPAAGDPDHGVPPGTRFEDLPADWVCPICGAAASDFERDT